LFRFIFRHAQLASYPVQERPFAGLQPMEEMSSLFFFSLLQNCISPSAHGHFFYQLVFLSF
jgi:hypothetical protein